MSDGHEGTNDVDGLLRSVGWLVSASAGFPHVIVTLDPPKVVWSNVAAENVFNAASRDKMSRMIFGTAPASRALAARLHRLAPGAPPHLERILLASGFRVDPLTLMCKAVEQAGGKATLIMQIVGTGRVLAEPAPAAGSQTAVATNDSAPISGVAAMRTADVDDSLEDEGRPLDENPVVAPSTPRTAAELAAVFAERFGSARVQRFVWQSDADGLLIEVGTAMAACLGATALRPRDSLLGRIRTIAPDAAEQIAAATAAGCTWSRVSVAWPIEDSDAAMAVTLGGVPRVGSDGGLRGFGILHLDAISTVAVPVAEPPAVAAKVEADPEAVVEAASASGAAHPAPDTHEPENEIEAVAPNAASEAAETVADHAEPITAEASSVDPTTIDGSSAPTPDAEETKPSRSTWLAANTTRSESEPASTPGAANVVHLSTFKTAAAQAQSPPSRVPKPTKVEPDEDTAEPLDAPRWAEMPENDAARSREATEARLSSNERYNFDEIARTLGAGPPAVAADPVASTADGGIDGPRPDVKVDDLAANASVLLDALPIGTIVSKNGRLLYANRTLLDLLAFDSLEAMRAASGLERLFGGQAAAMMLEGTAAQPVTITGRDGQMVAADVRIQSILWQHEPATLMSVRRSLDREVGAQIEAIRLDLQKSQATARDLGEALDFAVSGIGFLDMTGRILSINVGAERLFGYDQREVVGDLCSMLLSPEQKAQWSTFFDGFTSGQGGGRTAAFRRFGGRKRNGDNLRLAASLKRVGADKICILWNDESHRQGADTELEVARRDAERASDLKSEFLAKVSHEIRTPLNAILGFTEIIVDERFGPIGNDRYKDYLKDIHASGTHVMSLINDLLDLSRIEAGGLDLKLVSVDSNIVVGESVATLQGQAHRERIIIRSSLAPRLPPVLADERSLRQIILNLLSNAVKFNEPGGQVIVSTAVVENGAIAIRVRDTGLGMSEEEIETAMKPFRQLATPKASAGTGLGLPLTKALVDANHASMTIRSRPREGTLVEVLLQRAPPASVSLPAE